RPLQPPLDSRRTRGTRHPAHGDRVPDPRARRVGAGRCALRRGRDRAATLRDGLHDPGAPGPRAATRTTLDIHHPDLPGSGTSTRMLVHEVEDLLVRTLRSDRIAGTQRARDAVLQMVPHDELPHTTQRLVNRRDLRQDVRTVTTLRNHALETPNLTLDPTETGERTILQLGSDPGRMTRRPASGGRLDRLRRFHRAPIHHGPPRADPEVPPPRLC